MSENEKKKNRFLTVSLNVLKVVPVMQEGLVRGLRQALEPVVVGIHQHLVVVLPVVGEIKLLKLSAHVHKLRQPNAEPMVNQFNYKPIISN